MESILCLTDYKPNSDQTFRYALHIAHRLAAQLLLFHVFEAPGALMEDGDIRLPAGSPEYERYAQELQRLKEFASEHGAGLLEDTEIRFLVSGGSPRERILEVEEEYDLDMIVMGMRNRKGFADRLFGSLAYKMIDLLPCPLLLIPPEAAPREIRSIAYATDFGYDNLQAIEYLLRWSEVLDARLYLLHFSEDPEDNHRAETLMEKIMHTFDEENHENRMQFIVQEGDVQEGIEHFIENAQVDLIALTRHSRGFWEKLMVSSLAKDLAQTVEIPLLVFRE